MSLPFRRRALGAASTLVLAGATVLVAGAGTAGASTSAPSTSPSAAAVDRCAKALPPVVQGVPAGVKAGLAEGYWIWHDTTGWHLRVTHTGRSRVEFTGTVTATSPIVFNRVRDERNDHVARSANHRVMSWALANYGGVDGIDFGTSCATSVTFTLREGLVGHQHLAPTAGIHLGARKASPTSNPFRVVR